MKNIFGLIIISLFLLISCSKYKIIDETDLQGAFIINSSPTFEGYYYKGSDTNYHYFVSKWEFRRDKYFKIPMNRLNVIKVLNVQEQKREIKIDILENSNKVFAENEYCKLYYAE
jgi:hypothetical protein